MPAQQSLVWNAENEDGNQCGVAVQDGCRVPESGIESGRHIGTACAKHPGSMDEISRSISSRLLLDGDRAIAQLNCQMRFMYSPLFMRRI